MKTYIGLPLPPGADPKKDVPVVTVVDSVTGASIQLQPLPGGNFSWGKAGIYHGNLGRAILTDFLGDDPAVIRIYQRFAMRRILTLPPGQPFQMTGAEVAQTIASILEGEEGLDAIRSQIALEPTPVLSDSIVQVNEDGSRVVNTVENKG